MTARQKRILIGLGSLLGAVMLFWSAPAKEVAGQSTSIRQSDELAPAPEPSPFVATPEAAMPIAAEGGEFYAVELERIAGLPQDAPPGTEMELWVTWDRPITKVPKLHRLIRRVYLDQMVDPVEPGAPTMAILEVPPRRIPDLIWADGYGRLSAVLLDALHARE